MANCRDCARDKERESNGKVANKESHDQLAFSWSTIASLAFIVRATMVSVLLPLPPVVIAPPPGKNKLSWSWARQSASTTDVDGSVPIMQPPIIWSLCV